MKTEPSIVGMLSENLAGIGTVTRTMVHARARELAVINGRSQQDANKSDWEQAKRELTGEPEATAEEVIVDNAPESERWNPVPGSDGRQIPQCPSEDEDEEGRTSSARLVEEGVREAEHQQMFQAGTDQQKEDAS